MRILLAAAGLARRPRSLTRIVPQLGWIGSVRTLAKESEKKEEVGYWEQKKAAKERRRQLFQKKEERIERLKVRRHGRPRGQKKQEFKNFFIKKKVDEEYMDRKARQAGLGWKIQASTIVHRINVVLPDKEEWEVEYEMLRAYLDQFGKMYPEEYVGKRDYETIIQPPTDQEIMDQVPFELAPRETAADASGDVRTTDRRLKDNLYLVVQDGPDGLWQFPTVDVNSDDNETLLSAAKRAVTEKVGTKVEYWCPSNCPWSVELTAYPEEKQRETGCYGIKNFFMLVGYDEGPVSEEEMKVKDYAWLDRGEIVERVAREQGEFKSRFYHYML